MFVAKHCEQKYIIEKKVLEWAQNQNGQKVFAEDLEDGYPKFPRCRKLALNYEAFEEHDITDSAVELNLMKMTAKILFACICTLLEDALSWYNEYGPNIGLTNNNGEKNQTLQLYL